MSALQSDDGGGEAGVQLTSLVVHHEDNVLDSPDPERGVSGLGGGLSSSSISSLSPAQVHNSASTFSFGRAVTMMGALGALDHGEGWYVCVCVYVRASLVCVQVHGM
jgi:hypothetical protein